MKLFTIIIFGHMSSFRCTTHVSIWGFDQIHTVKHLEKVSRAHGCIVMGPHVASKSLKLKSFEVEFKFKFKSRLLVQSPFVSWAYFRTFRRKQLYTTRSYCRIVMIHCVCLMNICGQIQSQIKWYGRRFWTEIERLIALICTSNDVDKKHLKTICALSQAQLYAWDIEQFMFF